MGCHWVPQIIFQGSATLKRLGSTGLTVMLHTSLPHSACFTDTVVSKFLPAIYAEALKIVAQTVS